MKKFLYVFLFVCAFFAFTKSVFAYEGENWTRATAATPWAGRTEHESVVFNNRIWVMGGRSSGSYLNDIWSSSDGVSWKQEVKAASWKGRAGFGLTVYNNKMWLIGGFVDGSGYSGEIWSSSDGINWELVEAQPEWWVRANMKLLVFDNKLWLIGGEQQGSLRADAWNTTDGKTWTNINCVPWFLPKNYFGAVVFNNKLWVMGGRNKDSLTNDVYFSEDGSVWKAKATSTAWSAREGMELLVYNNKMWLIGGRTSQGETSEIWVSNDGVSWKLETSKPGWAPREDFSALVFNNKMWAIGGSSLSAKSDDVWYSTIPSPTVSLKANNSLTTVNIAYGASANLSWTTHNADSCTGSGDWSGAKSVSNAGFSTGNLTAKKTYTLTCTNFGGATKSASITVNVNSPLAPVVDIKAGGQDGPITVQPNTAANISWTTTNAEACTASGGWSGNKGIASAGESTGNLTISKVYTITCSGPGGNSVDSVIVNVAGAAAAELPAVQPTENNETPSTNDNQDQNLENSHEDGDQNVSTGQENEGQNTNANDSDSNASNSTNNNWEEQEKELFSFLDSNLIKRLKGRILLQIEEHGEAWYVIDSQKFYLKNGVAAYQALRKFGLGITDADLAKIPVGIEPRFLDTDSDDDGLADKLEEGLKTDPLKSDTDGDGLTDGYEIMNNLNPLGSGKLVISKTVADKLLGRILLQVESRGEAWYINPSDGKRYYMKDGNAAYQIMRFLSLGIKNIDLRKIPVGILSE